MARLRANAGGSAGFTVVELAVVVALTTVMVSLGAVAARRFFQTRALQGAQDQVVAQMRESQQRSIAESYPIVYGLRFLKGTGNYGVVRYNAANQSCQVVNSQTFDGGIQVVNDAETDFPDVTTLTTACRNATPNASANYEIVFFYPKGSTNATATIGSVKLLQPATGQTKKVTVSPLTGRPVRS